MEKANIGAVISARHAIAECDELRLEHAHNRLMPVMASEAIWRTAVINVGAP